MLALALSLLTPAIYAEAAAPAIQEELINEAYSFKISPDEDTRLILTREQAQGIAPDAFAGIQQADDTWALIIAEWKSPGSVDRRLR